MILCRGGGLYSILNNTSQLSHIITMPEVSHILLLQNDMGGIITHSKCSGSKTVCGQILVTNDKPSIKIPDEIAYTEISTGSQNVTKEVDISDTSLETKDNGAAKVTPKQAKLLLTLWKDIRNEMQDIGSQIFVR